MKATTGVILFSFCLLIVIERPASADDPRESLQLQQPAANAVGGGDLDAAEASAVMMSPYVPDANAWLQLQALRQRAAAHEARMPNIDDALEDIPEKRHLCRAKYVYNPVSGKCQPSLSALRQSGRRR